MAIKSVISEEMLALVGKVTHVWIQELDRTAIRLFARAVGYTDPVYYDVEAARGRGFRDLVAPPGFFGIPIFDPQQPLFVDPNGSWPWVTGILNGGTDIEYIDSPCAGDRVEARRKVVSWSERETSVGHTVILREDVEYRRDGELIAIEHDTALYMAGSRPSRKEPGR